MKKSLYSLTLFDEVIERIDQLAYENRTNRSQLVNDILARYVGLETPEQKIQAVLEELDDNFSDVLSVSQIVKNNSIQFGKSLKYKYLADLTTRTAIFSSVSLTVSIRSLRMDSGSTRRRNQLKRLYARAWI